MEDPIMKRLNATTRSDILNPYITQNTQNSMDAREVPVDTSKVQVDVRKILVGVRKIIEDAREVLVEAREVLVDGRRLPEAYPTDGQEGVDFNIVNGVVVPTLDLSFLRTRPSSPYSEARTLFWMRQRNDEKVLLWLRDVEAESDLLRGRNREPEGYRSWTRDRELDEEVVRDLHRMKRGDREGDLFQKRDGDEEQKLFGMRHRDIEEEVRVLSGMIARQKGEGGLFGMRDREERQNSFRERHRAEDNMFPIRNREIKDGNLFRERHGAEDNMFQNRERGANLSGVRYGEGENIFPIQNRERRENWIGMSYGEGEGNWSRERDREIEADLVRLIQRREKGNFVRMTFRDEERNLFPVRDRKMEDLNLYRMNHVEELDQFRMNDGEKELNQFQGKDEKDEGYLFRRSHRERDRLNLLSMENGEYEQENLYRLRDGEGDRLNLFGMDDRGCEQENLSRLGYGEGEENMSPKRNSDKEDVLFGMNYEEEEEEDVFKMKYEEEEEEVEEEEEEEGGQEEQGDSYKVRDGEGRGNLFRMKGVEDLNLFGMRYGDGEEDSFRMRGGGEGDGDLSSMRDGGEKDNLIGMTEERRNLLSNRDGEEVLNPSVKKDRDEGEESNLSGMSDEESATLADVKRSESEPPVNTRNPQVESDLRVYVRRVPAESEPPVDTRKVPEDNPSDGEERTDFNLVQEVAVPTLDLSFVRTRPNSPYAEARKEFFSKMASLFSTDYSSYLSSDEYRFNRLRKAPKRSPITSSDSSGGGVRDRSIPALKWVDSSSEDSYSADEETERQVFVRYRPAEKNHSPSLSSHSSELVVEEDDVSSEPVTNHIPVTNQRQTSGFRKRMGRAWKCLKKLFSCKCCRGSGDGD